jgi:hypothetical protein
VAHQSATHTAGILCTAAAKRCEKEKLALGVGKDAPVPQLFNDLPPSPRRIYLDFIIHARI